MSPRKYPTEQKTTTSEGIREYRKLQQRDIRERRKQKAYFTDLLARMSNWTCKLFLRELASFYKVLGKHPSLDLLVVKRPELAIEHLSIAFQRAGRSGRSTAYMLACSYELLTTGEGGRCPFAFVTNWILDVEACAKDPSERNIQRVEWKWRDIPEKWQQIIQDELPPTYKSYFDIVREEKEAIKK